MQNKKYCDTINEIILFNYENMSLEKQNTSPDILEKANQEVEKLNPRLENETDKTLAWELLTWYKWDPSLSPEYKLKVSYNNQVDELISKNLWTLEQTKIDQLKAQKLQESEWKSPQEILASFREIKELIWTDVAEANKRNSEMIAQQTSVKQNLESQKQSDFMTQLKDAIKLQAENQEKTRQENKEKFAQNNTAVEAEKKWADWYLESMLEKGALDAKA